MSEPLISIVLPTYNGETYITEAIQSCIAQTYTNWELIVVNDASTDRTIDIVRAYVSGDSRIQLINHKVNRKLPAALNTGFTAANGEFLTWMSDDNLYHPHALEKMERFLEINPGVDIVYSDYSIIDANGKVIQPVTVKPPHKLAIGCIVGASFLYRRIVHETVGQYSDSLFLAEDYDFWLRASLMFVLSPLHDNLYYYREHRQRLGVNHQQQVFYSTFKAKEKTVPKLRWLNRSQRAIAYLHMARDGWRISRSVGRKYLVNAFLVSPVTTIRFLSQQLLRQ